MAKILIVNHRYWPAASGSERWLIEIGQRWAADGHVVTVATTDGVAPDSAWNPRAARAGPMRETQAGVDIRRFPLRHLPGSPPVYSLWRYVLFPALTRAPVSNAQLLAWARFTPWCPALADWLKRGPERFEWVVGANVLVEGLLHQARQAATRWGARFVAVPFTHLGAGPAPGTDSVARMYTLRHQRRVVTSADLILTMTPTERAFYLAQGAAPDRVQVVGAGYNPADVARGDGQSVRRALGWGEDPLVLYLAPLHGDKGLWQVVAAAERLWRSGSTLRLVLIGSEFPSSRQRLQSVHGRFPGRLLIKPGVSEAEKQAWLAAADALVMPSRTDSFGIVFLEAWAHARPVIGSTAWGMADVIIDGVDGGLVPFGDAQALAALLARWLADSALRDRLGQAGQRKALSEHTWDAVYARVKATLR
jgi:glycosyltransferase involved in cell wall biosynthesis